MTRRSAWNNLRWSVHERQQQHCLHCAAPLGYARFCVVKNGAGYMALCRACCCSHYAPVRLAKVRARRHRAQLPIQEVS